MKVKLNTHSSMATMKTFSTTIFMETPGLKSHQSVPELVTPDKSGPAKSPGFKVLIAKKGVAQLGLDLRTESA